MASLNLPALTVRTQLAIWLGVGFVGGAVALFALWSIVESSALPPGEFALGFASRGRQVLCFIAGISLGSLALWGMYSQIQPSDEDAMPT
jgi:hypothetical protein